MGHIRLQEEPLSTRLHRRDDQITHLGERGGEERERERREGRRGGRILNVYMQVTLYITAYGATGDGEH